ncbi:SDR family oxidoreductase [Streptomyces sp. NBRC 110028]|uniref:SDR family oxidoreductase n=1 Tax=Streptomyces sp. NBRC 110028 TaxID=1621260 RepID=UPI000A4C7BE6|nr:SDR family NAD(P)-dependent oxidoreductase [Streptomyces sp. NBRC 110028]
MAGHLLYPNWSVYSATKAAVAHLTRNLRAELGPRDVRVTNVEPGVTVTELGNDMSDPRMRATLTGMRTTLTPSPPKTQRKRSPSRSRPRRM